MAYNLTQIATQALRDIGELRPGQSTSTDVTSDILFAANEMLDKWTLDRILVYYVSSAGPPVVYSVLAAFPDLTTTYTFAPGYLRLLRKGLATVIAPMMKIYFKLEQPMLDQVEQEAAEAVKAIRGVGIPGVV
jgi:hypothetical protein